MRAKSRVMASLATAAFLGAGIVGVSTTPAFASKSQCSVASNVCIWTNAAYGGTYGLDEPSTSNVGDIFHDAISSMWNRYAGTMTFWEDTGYAGRNITFGSGVYSDDLDAWTTHLGPGETWNDRIDSHHHVS